MIFKKSRSITKTISGVIVIIIIIIAGLGAYYYYLSTIPTKPAISGSITVAVEPGYNDAAIEQIAKNFEAAYPGTTIHIADVSYFAIDSTYTTAFKAGQDVYDVVYFSNAGQLGNFYQYLVPLQNYITNTTYFPSSYNFSDIIPSTYAAYTINGNLYGLPMQSDVMLMFYVPSYFTNATNQQEFLAEFGYPLPNPANTTYTVQDLLDVASFFNHAHGSHYGIMFNADSDDDDLLETFSQIVAGTRMNDTSIFGSVNPTYGVLYSSTGQLLINSSQYISLLSDFATLTNETETPFGAEWGAWVSYFETPGASPILFSYSYPMFTMSQYLGSDWAIAPSTVGGAAMLGGLGFGIYNGTHNLPLALKFVAYATSQNQSVYYMTLDSLPPFRYSEFRVAETELNLSPTVVSEFLSNLKTAQQVEANEPYEAVVGSSFAATVPYILNGKMSAATAANLIESEAVLAGATPWTTSGASGLLSQLAVSQGGTSLISGGTSLISTTWSLQNR